MANIESLVLDGLSLNGRTSYQDAVLTDGPLTYLRMPDLSGTAATNGASTGYSSNVRAAILALTPALFWRLNETAGTTITDSSGNGRNGTYSGITLNQTAIVPGDPSPDVCVNVPNSGTMNSTYVPNPNGTEVRTWMAFAKRTNTADDDVYWGQTGGSGGYSLKQNAGASSITLTNYSGTTVTWTTTGLSVNAIHHIALVHDAGVGSAELYVNGISCGLKTGITLSATANTATLGFAGVGGTWTGNISEFAIFERGLTPQEIARVASYMYVWTYGSTIAANLNQTSLLVGDLLDKSAKGVAADSNSKISGNILPLLASGTGSFTWEALVNRNGDSTSQMALASAGGSSAGMVIKDQPGSGGLYMGVNEGSVTGVTWGNGTIPSTGVHHLVVTYNNVTFTAEAFVDGVSKGTRTFSSGLNNLATMEFFRSVDGGFSRSWGGPIDEAAFYNGILSAARIQVHYVASVTSPTDIILQGYDVPPPNKRLEWAQSADFDGAALVRDPLCDNREVTLRLRIRQQSSKDSALAQLGVLSKKLEEAEQQPDGLPLVWTPADATKTMTMYVLSGVVESLPIVLDGDDQGWLLGAQQGGPSPVVNVKLTCKPYGYGTQFNTSSATSGATPYLNLVLPSIPGDVPAEGVLQVSDTAAQIRRHIEAGLEWRYFNAATSNIIDSDNMVTSGFQGTQTTRSGAYDPNASGNNVIRMICTNTTLAACGTGDQTHVGTFRVKARVYVSALTATTSLDAADKVKIRLTWQDGDGPLQSNAYASAPIQGQFCEVDLGIITISPSSTTTQRWAGQVEAYTGNLAGTDTVDVDYLLLVPAGEWYGKGHAELDPSDPPGTFTARDEFDQTAGAISGKTAPVGGNWTSAGDATDLAVVAGSTHDLERSTNLTETNGRWATIGSAATLSAAQVDVGLGGDFTCDIRGGVIIRFSGSVGTTENALVAYCEMITNTIKVAKFVNHTATVLGTYPFPSGFMSIVNQRQTLRLAADTWGRWWLYVARVGTLRLALSGKDPALATGGALASGTVGIYDRCVTLNGVFTGLRFYDNFGAWVPTTNFVLNASSQARFTSTGSGAQRLGTAATYFGDMPNFRGGRFLVPAAGDENRSSRILVKAYRNDIETEPSDQVTDGTSAICTLTPRYMVVPF